MRTLPIILVLALTAIWSYVSWYWYTCSIKGFCGVEVVGEPDSKPSITNSGGVLIQQTQTTPELGDINEQPTISEGKNEKEAIPEPEPEICEEIVSKAISLGSGTNDNQEVENLENFLNNTQGESLEINGRYSQEDFEAVKRFQLKYREDILDPWSISAPTGYVFTTTIKKINEIHCGNNS